MAETVTEMYRRLLGEGVPREEALERVKAALLWKSYGLPPPPPPVFPEPRMGGSILFTEGFNHYALSREGPRPLESWTPWPTEESQ